MKTQHSSLELNSTFKSPSAFTLIEVVIAMTLIALLSGMVFGIVGLSVQAASSMQQSQLENDSVNRLIALCRQTFQRLPGTAILTLKIIQTGDPALQEITISGAPETFPFGTKPLSYKDSIIGLRPDIDATNASETKQAVYNLSLSREDLIPADPNQSASLSRSSGEGVAAPDDQGRYWMPLLPNTLSLHWRFYKEADDTWEEEWSDTNLPQLVEMNLQLQGRSQPIRVIYALPITKLSGANKALAPKATPSAAAAQPGAAATGGGGAPGKGKGPGGKGTGKGGGTAPPPPPRAGPPPAAGGGAPAPVGTSAGGGK